MRLVVITSDEPFYSSIENAASTYGWKVSRTASVAEAMGRLRQSPAPLIVYDCTAMDGQWEADLDRMTAVGGGLCVVLASRVVDDYLLQDVVRRGGEDIVPRSADRVIQAVRFASFRRRHGQI